MYLSNSMALARGLCRLPDWAFYLLLWLSVAAGLFVYIGIFLKNSLDVQQTEWIKQIAASLCAGLVLSAILLSTLCNHSIWQVVFVGQYFIGVKQFLSLCPAVLLFGDSGAAIGS